MRYLTYSFIIFLSLFYFSAFGQSIESQRVTSNHGIISKSIPFFVIRKQSKKFHFKESYHCRKPFSMTMEMAKSPIWFAIEALPYLIDEQNGSTEQVLNAYFANSVALYLLNKEVGLDVLMAYWKKEPGNRPENEMHRRIGYMFDTTVINQRMGDEILKLQQSQLADGSWPWFPGMKGNRYITQLICTGIGRLFDMHIYDKYSDRLNDMGMHAFSYMDEQMTNDYEDIVSKKENLKDNHLTSDIIAYLYSRTFWNGLPIGVKAERPLYYWQEQCWANWRSRSLLEKARLVSAFYRQGEDTVYIKMFRAIDSQAVHSHDKGVYWKENSGNTTQKIETQAMLLEGYNIMRFPAPETRTLEGMKQWLLRLKQPDRWTTSTATADAVYALLRNDDDSVITNNFPKITVSGKPLDVSSGQGSGYWYRVWKDKEITSRLKHIQIQTDSDTTAWVDITMQYNQKKSSGVDVKGITATKQVYFLTKENGVKWELLSKKTDLKEGDSLKVNLVVKTSKDIDYVLVQSPVDENTEQPVDKAAVHFRDGLSIEQSFGSNSADFFIEKLKTGEYTFSYKLVVKEKGPFENGKEVEVEKVY